MNDVAKQQRPTTDQSDGRSGSLCTHSSARYDPDQVCESDPCVCVCVHANTCRPTFVHVCVLRARFAAHTVAAVLAPLCESGGRMGEREDLGVLDDLIQ